MSLSAAHNAAIARATAPGFAGLALLEPLERGQHLAVFDSSFNPPHRAHFGLGVSEFPPPATVPSSTSPTPSPGDVPNPGPYTARLLLFSTRNADKSPAGDTAHRVGLMQAQARAMAAATRLPVSVGLISAPTFVDKSAALLQHAQHVTFLVGTDTLLRIFDDKYYPAPGGMSAALEKLFARCWFVCALRDGYSREGRAQADALFARDDVAHYVALGKIRTLPPIPGAEAVSSTDVRSIVREGRGRDALEELVVPEVAEYILANRLYT
ncbi:Putative nicotinamide mononucleotide adenylyltransferase [Vanrija pseudolonga]|uniref:Nicotinamide mononucleotide adenylyltransferase n=1 Tax=Vanrija pseudolonga TaxID=143232 RepID=A0AAF1BF77_9TREE|nr:Putative nicotinamide mononucleotide adenylyltransferase [Vanrija pseudolonga]